MDFKNNIINLSERIKIQKDAAKTEEATKIAFIMPMISALGYDIFNPFEVIPEMDCDLTKRGDKIDYAIQKDGKTVILIECKQSNVNLNLHDTQLAKYYAASNARFGILTNGIEYRFYADINKNNIMDEKPFLVIDMLNISDEDLEQLKMFHKSCFDECNILSSAQDLKYYQEMKKLIKDELDNPSFEFVRILVKKNHQWSFSQKTYEQFYRIVKDSFNSVINDIIQDKLQLHNNIDMANSTLSGEQDNEVITTKEQLEAYNIIKNILKNLANENEIMYINYKSYFVVSIRTKVYWICRLHFNSSRKTIGFPIDGYKGEKQIEIKSLDEIHQYSKLFNDAYRNAITMYNKWNNK